MDDNQRKEAFNSRSYHQMMVDELKRDIDADNLRLLELQYSQRLSELENKERIVQTIIEIHEKNKSLQGSILLLKRLIMIVSGLTVINCVLHIIN